MPDTISILTSSSGAIHAKAFSGQSREVQEISPPKMVSVSTAEVSDLSSLASLLSELEADQSKCVIRGAVNVSDNGLIRRGKGNFSSAARRWCMIDIDGADWTGDFQDKEAMVAHAVSHLPAEFHDADCWYHFSSSMGIKPGIRLHLWYWLERPCSDDEMKVWLASCPVDPALFNPVQLHFTANPLFLNGAIDPYPNRSGIYKAGSDKQSVPVPEDLKTRTDRHSSLVRPRTRNRSGTLDPATVIRDPKTGLAIDGREQLMFLLSNEVMSSLVTASYTPSEDEITEALWMRFQEEADTSVVSDRGPWTVNDARSKARARAQELSDGTYTFVSRSDNTSLLPGLGQAERRMLVSAKVAQRELDKFLGSFFDRLASEENPRSCVRLTMGTGKTTQTIDHLRRFLADRRGQLIEVYVPRHDLAEEWEEKLGAIEARVVHVYPRTGGSFDVSKEAYTYPVMCQRAEYVRDLEDKGHSIFPNACLSRVSGEQCEYFSECNYLGQFRENTNDSSNTIRIYTHAYLFLPRNEFERQRSPDLVIIDEAFLSSAVSNILSVSKNDVIEHVRLDDCRSLGFDLVDCLSNHNGNFSFLRDKGIGAAQFQSVSLEHLNPAPAFEAGRVESRNVSSVEPYRSLVRLIELAAKELEDEGKNSFEQLVIHDSLSEIMVCDQRPMRIPRSASLLYLDATADPIISEPYLPNLEVHRIDVHQLAVVSQVHDRTGSNLFWNDKIEKEERNLKAPEYSENDNDLASLITVLNEWAKAGEKPLLIGHKKLCDFIGSHPKLADGVDVAHFMSLRGTDTYKDNSVVFITGRNQPPPISIDQQARAVFGNQGFPLNHDDTKDLPEMQVDYWLSDRSVHPPSGILVRSFSDQRIDAVQKQIREAETLQAIARLRLVWSTYQKRVFLLSNLPVEMPVDHLISFNELMPDKLEMELIKRGDLPLTGRSLVQLRPDLGYSEDAAKKAVGRSKAPDPRGLLLMLPDLVRSTTQIASYKAGTSRSTLHQHLFLPKDFKGEPDSSNFTPWSEQEVLAHLEGGWGVGGVTDLELGFLYGPEAEVSG